MGLHQNPMQNNAGIPFLQTLEALYIREIKLSLNTRGEFTSRELLLKF